MKIDQQSYALVREFQIRQNRRSVNGIKSFHRLQLDNCTVVHENIQPVAAVELTPPIDEWNRFLPLDSEAAARQLMRETGFAGGLQQSRAQFPMSLYRGADDATGDLIDVHLGGLCGSVVNIPFLQWPGTSHGGMPEPDLSMHVEVL